MIKKLRFTLLLFAYTFSYAQDNYLDFDGVNDVVTVTGSDNLLANSTSITMSCKVYPRRITSGFPNFNGFMGYRNESNFDFYLIQLSSTDVEARFRNSSGTAYTITYTGLTLNEWTQFFLVYNGTDETLTLYNGDTEVGSVPASGSVPANSTGALKLGLISYQSFNWYHDGKIDEASVWNKALSLSEISTIVSNGGEISNPLGEANLMLYYKFNQGIPYGNNTTETLVNDELEVYNGTVQNFTLTGSSSNWGSDSLGTAQHPTSSMAVYPNPATDFITLSGVTTPLQVQIVDVSGRIVSESIVADEATKMDVSTLQNGMYIIQTTTGLKMKFIKQ
jgi:hypothetical protein